jgi:sporulation protein YlmC with PRC-barrel domain
VRQEGILMGWLMLQGISRLRILGKVVGLMIAAAALTMPLAGKAENPGKVDTEAAEMAAELIGAPVFAMDGSEVGEIADISLNEENEPRRLRVRVAAHLGLGARVVDVPKGAFILLRGAAVLEVPANAVLALPELNENSDDK